MKTLRKFLKSLRVFKRLRLLEYKQKMLFSEFASLNSRLLDVQNFIASREPCKSCGHHRYRQKTLHYDGCTRGDNRSICNGSL